MNCFYDACEQVGYIYNPRLLKLLAYTDVADMPDLLTNTLDEFPLEMALISVLAYEAKEIYIAEKMSYHMRSPTPQ